MSAESRPASSLAFGPCPECRHDGAEFTEEYDPIGDEFSYSAVCPACLRRAAGWRSFLGLLNDWNTPEPRA